MKIEILYPEICNLYGDLANAKYLAASSDAEIITTSLGDEPAFVSEDIALVYIGTTTEKGQELARDALKPYLPQIEKRTENGGVTLVTGNALEIFGEYIECDNGERLPMLGMFPIHSQRRLLERYNSLYLGKFDNMDIVGFKSQFGHSYGDCGEGLFTTVRGAGLNPDVKSEGIRKNNFMATYIIGPLVIVNPPFAEYILTLIGIKNPKILYREAAMDAYNTRVQQFKQPDRGFLY